MHIKKLDLKELNFTRTRSRKKGQIKPKRRRQKTMIKVRAETNEIETRKTKKGLTKLSKSYVT